MKFFDITEKPIKIYGLAVVNKEEKKFWKLPAEMIERMPQLEYLGKRTTGGRVRFCTDSSSITIRMTLKQVGEDINFPTAGSAGADVYYGRGQSSIFAGYIAPGDHSLEEVFVEKTFAAPGKMDIVTINLPRNDHLSQMEIGIEDTATIQASPEYVISDPIVFYGSSITEGGCCSRVGNAYTSVVSRWLDADYKNYGFSGNAKGEEEFANFIASHQKMSVFVYDYDHNTPSVEHLKATHRRFFQIIRDAHPALPVVMMSRPDTDPYTKEIGELRDAVYETYRKAKEAGDQNVYFVDGGQFFGSVGRAECTIDGCHPNALGFMRMSETLYPIIKNALGKSLSIERNPFN